MKKHLFFVLMLISTVSFAQQFEGTIRWSMKMDITDPKKKAQMETAQKQMSDPANQAKMKELQTKMNDPQFKAMMDGNPQLKAQMEKMIAAIGSGDVSSMIPKGMVVKMKNENALSKMEGGMFAQEFLYLKAKDQSYMIDRENKTYSVVKHSEKAASKADDVKFTVTRTGETAKVLQYNCTKYKVDMEGGDQKMTQYVWATTEIKDIDFKALAKQQANKGQRMFYEGIDGVPLKMEMAMPDGKMLMEVTEIKKGSLPASDFTLPADFKEVPMPFGG